MTRRQIDRFFKILTSELRVPARAYLTGAAAGALMGRIRPSLDIDLGLELRGRAAASWDTVEGAIARTTKLTGIPASVAEDIDRWGMITLLDYRRASKPYRAFGRLQVRVLAPAYWSIGKLTRFLDADVRDMTVVLKRQAVAAATAVRLWGRALRASPASTSQFSFRRHVETFLRANGTEIWGRRFDVPLHIRLFHRAAKISSPAPGRLKHGARSAHARDGRAGRGRPRSAPRRRSEIARA